MKAVRAKIMVACALFAAQAWSAGWAARAHVSDQRVVREYRAEVALDVDAQGRVATIDLPAGIPAMLAGPAREAIGQWRFKAPMRDGHAVTAHTYVRLALQVVQQAAGDYGVRAVYRSNGPKLRFTRRLEYPPIEIRRRGQGKLVMEASVSPDGTLTDIHVASYRFNHPNPGAFVKSAEAVLQNAHAQPERVDGQPVATRVQVPFVYVLKSLTRSEALAREATRDPAAATAEGFNPIGEPVALDSPVQLIVDLPPG